LRRPPAVRGPCGRWIPAAARRPSMTGPATFFFLNEEHTLQGPKDWNKPQWDKLWLYNLHYFDDLNAEGAEVRRDWHLALMRRWVAENPPGVGNGWEPYPTALRMVNWIKWALARDVRDGIGRNRIDEELLHSLAVQARWLVERLERHLLGNHLFANAKALVFAGLFFEGREADGWLDKGREILQREISEQVLPDGGHFERSPMYHAVVLEDLLDLINIQKMYGECLSRSRQWDCFLGKCVQAVQRMREWLAAMCHPDGEIVLFNDAAFGIAPLAKELNGYAERLGLGHISFEDKQLIHLKDTGYIRVRKGPFVAFLDVAPIGPDYLPGHAHADTLSFELSLDGRRFVVDSGVSCYGADHERLRQRSTAAHNTVTVDGKDSSEVWGGFRVARRAYPQNLEVEEIGEEVRIACSHDGYRRLPGKVTHRREWQFGEVGLKITDRIEGKFSKAVGRVHFHPDVRVAQTGVGCGEIRMDGGRRIAWRVDGGRSKLVSSTYHPEFGVSVANQCLEIRFEAQETVFQLRWQ